jgi:hypothetical protein
MSAQNKQDLLQIVGRSSKVIDDEIALLDDWARQATVARQARCLARKQRIATGDTSPRAKMDTIQDDVNNLAPANVHSSPSPPHTLTVESNESFLAARSTLDVNDLPDGAFTRMLDLSEGNARDSVRDAQAVVRDCTS